MEITMSKSSTLNISRTDHWVEKLPFYAYFQMLKNISNYTSHNRVRQRKN